MVNGKRYIVMKKYLLCVVITILFVACDSTNDLGTPFTKGQEVTLTAVIGEQHPQMLPGMQRVSGVDAGEAINLVWNNGDKILVKVDDHSAEFTLSNGAGTGEGTFTGIMPADGTSFHVEYPIDYSDAVLKVQQYVPNGFGKGLMKMSTKQAGTIDNGFTLSADNALLGLQLTGDGEIGKIVLSRNNAEGKAGDDSYTLLCPNITLTAKPTLFYIVVLPGTWEKGFTVEVFDNDNSVVIDKFVKNSSITFGTDNAIIMPEKNVQNLPDPCMVVQVNETLSFNMMCVEGGTFMMGAMESDTQANDNEKPAHEVTLSDYYISDVQVSQALWEVVMGTTVEEEVNRHGGEKDLGKGPNLPMYAVDWFQAKEFAAKLSQLTGLQFSLPTEAEWEYAARGGQLSKGYKFAGSNNLDEVAWWGDPKGLVHPSAQKKPNELGIYDMCGNICEWTLDGYSDYTTEAQTNPCVPRVDYVVQRSMSAYAWWKEADHRVTFRYKKDPKVARTRVGFRIVLHDTVPVQPEPEYVDLGLSVHGHED